VKSAIFVKNLLQSWWHSGCSNFPYAEQSNDCGTF